MRVTIKDMKIERPDETLEVGCMDEFFGAVLGLSVSGRIEVNASTNGFQNREIVLRLYREE